MLLEFSVQNYRSIKEEQTFSLVAGSSMAKPDNFSVQQLYESTMPVLKSAVIYGANASGKTNIIRAFSTCVFLIKESAGYVVQDPIKYYDPFLFDEDAKNSPTFFRVTFIGLDHIKYKYQFSYNKEEIIHESLDYFPKGQTANLFTRKNDTVGGNFVHEVRLGNQLKDQRIDKKLFKNQLYLSQFGSRIVHEQLTPIFLYFKEIETWNAVNKGYIDNYLQNNLIKELLAPENIEIKKRLSKLIRIADTKIEDVRIEEKKPTPAQKKEYTLYGRHSVYRDNNKTGGHELPFQEESAGSNVLYIIGGLILKKLTSGGILFVDELDNSLHPKLSKFLIKLFNNPVSNPKNAQLVCATHEVTLLDKDMFRTDQVWFTEKNKFGGTELYSISDFEGTREGIPFDKWYQSGKFGGEPRIKEIEFIFGDE
ncbi:MAG: ATP-binding protein [Tannerella sp.]|nr:ATP-binding protein [Tannerella sp.]